MSVSAIPQYLTDDSSQDSSSMSEFEEFARERLSQLGGRTQDSPSESSPLGSSITSEAFPFSASSDLRPSVSSPVLSPINIRSGFSLSLPTFGQAEVPATEPCPLPTLVVSSPLSSFPTPDAVARASSPPGRGTSPRASSPSGDAAPGSKGWLEKSLSLFAVGKEPTRYGTDLLSPRHVSFTKPALFYDVLLIPKLEAPRSMGIKVVLSMDPSKVTVMSESEEVMYTFPISTIATFRTDPRHSVFMFEHDESGFISCSYFKSVAFSSIYSTFRLCIKIALEELNASRASLR